jgi:hypothetical protein
MVEVEQLTCGDGAVGRLIRVADVAVASPESP